MSSTVWADVLNWNDLEEGNKYSVATDIPFTENLTWKADSPVYFEEVYTGMAPVLVFTFKDANCTDPEFELEQVLFNPEPEDTVHNKEIGIQFSKECNITIFVEPQYYYDKSIFTN